MDVSIETLCSQCFIPAQGGNASLTGVCVAHICRGAGCWVTQILHIRVAQEAHFLTISAIMLFSPHSANIEISHCTNKPVRMVNAELGLLKHWTPCANAWMV